jgi:hypothetical protein
MGISARVLIAFVLIGGAAVGQWALLRHLEAAEALPAAELVKPLAELPLEIGPWRGGDTTIDPQALIGDEHLQRTYIHTQRHQALTLWVVYSRRGQDRAHHPEVCMAVAGQPEDTSVRQAFPVPGHAAPVQQYRFGSTGRSQWVFYWHYELPQPAPKGLDPWQELYRRIRQRPSSVTLEVFAPAISSDDGEAAREFVKLIDAEIQKHVGPGARRGSRRVPVTVIPQGQQGG